MMTVQVVPDTTPEGDETFHLSLGASHHSPDLLNADVTILGDD